MDKVPENNPPPTAAATRSLSLTEELFGAKESEASPPPSSSPGKLSSMFLSPPTTTTAMGRSTSSSELVKSIDRASAAHQVWNRGPSEDLSTADKFGSSQTHAERSSILQHRTTAPSCTWTSSVNYGSAEDYYVPSSDAQSRGSYREYNGNGDDSNCASRGDWWQGSFYY